MTDEVKNYDALMAEIEKRKFRFELDGQQWSLRSGADVNYRPIRDASVNGTDLEATEAVFRHAMGPEQWARFEAIEDIPASVLRQIFDDYMEFSGIDQGKSPGSTDSSESTEQPSKPPSKPRTKSPSRASSTGRSRRAGSSSS